MSDPTNTDDSDDEERAALIERALLANQQLEREEAEADLKRQQQIDDAIINSLASRDPGPETGTGAEPGTDEPTT
jgi:hypothetical protein